jgi:hypothetical protein
MYYAATGIYFFYDSYIPIAVFLGMHLLFTDPSTSPRTELGRIIFGVLYGLSTVALYEILGRAGLPTFYDKLLQVPILNLSIRLIDRAARSDALRRLDPAAIASWLAPRQRNLAYISLWTLTFAVMSGAEGVGDHHPGQWVPFWQQACQADKPWACSYLADLEAGLCRQGSGWACNELGLIQVERDVEGPGAIAAFEDGCAAGFRVACVNINRVRDGPPRLIEARPPVEELPILLRGSKAPMTERRPDVLYARACSQGWPDACER